MPADFDPAVGVLLIEEVMWPERQKRKIKDFLESDYPYKYEIVPIGDMSPASGKYTDTILYRFVMIYSAKEIVWEKRHVEDHSKSSQLRITTFDFNFVDRQTGKVYPKSGRAASWPALVLRDMLNDVMEEKKKNK